MIPYSDIWIEDDDILQVIATLKSGYNSSLPKVAEFEKDFAKYLGVKYAVALNSGTSALHASMFATGIKKGAEVITTPMTFAAASNSVLYMEGTPVFSDIDKKTYNLDPTLIESKITNNTKALVPVHYTGQPCDMDPIMQIAKDKGLYVIEDASHSPGATYKGTKTGTHGDATVFSFHPVKHIATYEGGMVTTNNEEIYDKVRLFRSHGITRERTKMGYTPKTDEDWCSDQIYLGYNYRMTDLQATLGISQLKKIDRSLKIRREYAKRYTEAFASLDFVTTPYQLPGTDSAWHLYALQLNPNKLGMSRAQVFHKLRNLNVGVWVHYMPVYYLSYYRALGYAKGQCTNAENLYENILSIPLFPKMKTSEIDFVINTIKSLRG